MYKYLLFSEPQSLVFYSSATALAEHNSHYFAVTKMKQLIFRSKEKECVKANIPLGKVLQLSRTENVSLLKVLSLETSSSDMKSTSVKNEFSSSMTSPSSNFNTENDTANVNVSSNEIKNSNATAHIGKTCSLLMGTTKLNFFVVLINMQNQKILEIQKVNFGYKSTLKRLSSNSCFINPKPGLTLMVSANFIFYMTSQEPRFKLLKILKEKALSVQVDFQKKDMLYILGKKLLIFGKIQELPGGALSFNETVRLQNKRKFIEMKAMRKKLVFMNKHRQIRIYELDKQDFTYKIEIFQSFKQSLKFSKMEVINGDIICVHDQKYLYCLSIKMNQIWQIVNLNDSHFAILPNGKVLTLQPKSENLYSVAQIKFKTYQKANKINKYLSLTKHEKLKIIFAYLSRKFLKLYKFQDYNKVIYNLLLKMNLSNGLIKQPEFKVEVLKLYNLINDFSLKIDRSAVKPSSMNNLERAHGSSKRFDSGSALESNKSGISSTSPSPRVSPKKKKTLNYMVVKPYVDVRLPRRNGIKESSSDCQILERIMIKGQKHYKLFLRFKKSDPYPNDCIDSIYARYQSRLKRIEKGKMIMKNCVRFIKNDPLFLADQLFFISSRFNMKNNIRLLNCIFMGIDLWLWASPMERKIGYQVVLNGIKEKQLLEPSSENKNLSLAVVSVMH
jgi:hypothetical protein